MNSMARRSLQVSKKHQNYVLPFSVCSIEWRNPPPKHYFDLFTKEGSNLCNRHILHLVGYHPQNCSQQSECRSVLFQASDITHQESFLLALSIRMILSIKW